MSRIFIENLPKNITQEVLQQKFAEKGEITDIQLRQDKRNAFIGYKQSEQAQNAVDYFNRTFIHTSKITVKIVDNYRLNKKVEKLPTISDEKSFDDETKKKKRKKIDPFEEVRNDPEFEDFLRLQRNIDTNNKSKEIWKDDVIANVHGDDDDDDDDVGQDEIDEDNHDKTVEKRIKKTFDFTVKIRGLPYKIKKSQLKEFLKPIKPMSMRFVPHVKGIAYVSFKNALDLQQAMIKHRGFIDGHRIEITKMEKQKQNKADNIMEENGKKFDKQNNDEQQEKEQPEPISESGRIFIRNLSYTCMEDDLRQLFEKFGTITELHMPIDSYTKKPKGFAFVTYMFPEHAILAFNQLDKTDFQGRLIHLLPAHMKNESTYNGPPPPSDDEMNDDNDEQQRKKSSTFKQAKNEENRQDAQNKTRWNTLFVRPNAVADIMSKNLNMNKLDLLTKSDRKSGNAAVRMALGEAQIVNEIKQFLLKNQVHLESFERGVDCPRSRTTILVKNLPSETQEQEIKTLFEKYGLINRVILPPYGLTAIVEMQESNEAKFAFKKLAYSNFNHYPLYLEWAPEDIFSGSSAKSSDKSIDVVDEKPEEIIIEDGSTIFVKNLNFDTTEEDFRQYFEDKIGPVHTATIATKKTAKGILSMGYGFIQFYKSKMAKEAIKKLQNSTLDGHPIEIKLSNRTTTSKTNQTAMVKSFSGKNRSGQKQTGSKICVKNIPFEATVEDVRKIFSSFGQIKSVRIPKKLAGSSQYRGFGFVDFVTKEDAKRAFDALSASAKMARYFQQNSNG
ncbi:rna-binding protein 19-like protein [Dermatophagoides farinae]|uniref:Rna-binding protein 19-like protein n=1 Tax=Dermatophagoides farinae TaxID=6954 RepID=A0A9D4NT90_DERFA|nr:rna-binding protein 19-like protein [Dermatophagoides farinae]